MQHHTLVGRLRKIIRVRVNVFFQIYNLKGDTTFWGTSEYSQKTLTDHMSIVSVFQNYQDFIIKFRFLSRSNIYRFLQTHVRRTFHI